MWSCHAEPSSGYIFTIVPGVHSFIHFVRAFWFACSRFFFSLFHLLFSPVSGRCVSAYVPVVHRSRRWRRPCRWPNKLSTIPVVTWICAPRPKSIGPAFVYARTDRKILPKMQVLTSCCGTVMACITMELNTSSGDNTYRPDFQQDYLCALKSLLSGTESCHEQILSRHIYHQIDRQDLASGEDLSSVKNVITRAGGVYTTWWEYRWTALDYDEYDTYSIALSVYPRPPPIRSDFVDKCISWTGVRWSYWLKFIELLTVASELTRECGSGDLFFVLLVVHVYAMSCLRILHPWVMQWYSILKVITPLSSSAVIHTLDNGWWSSIEVDGSFGTISVGQNMAISQTCSNW